MRRSRSRIDPFHHPAPEAFDFDTLLAAMEACRAQAARFRRACGVRNPAFEEATALIERVDALARLTRVPNAVERVHKQDFSDTAG